jgi:outer membrane biosynthesis protein TonB
MRPSKALLVTAALGALIVGAALFAQTPAPKLAVYSPPRLIHAEGAQYPDMTVARGNVILEAQLNRNGAVNEIRVVQDIPSLTGPAEAALREWRFSPAHLDDVPVNSEATVVFSFSPGQVPTGPGFTGAQPGNPAPANRRFEPAQVERSAEAAFPMTLVSGGTVVAEAHIDRQGKVEAIRDVQRVTGLTSEANQALKHWTFRPAAVDGKAVPDAVFIAFVFYRNAVYQPGVTRSPR